MTHVRQAVILAGGNATRLRPYTDRVPKALVDVGGRPILEHQVEWLAAEGVEHVVVSCGYLAEMMRRHVLGRTFPLRVSLAVEERPLGRGGGLKHAARSLPFADEPWLGLNGDILTRFPLADLVRQHADSGALATLGVTALKSPYGIVDIAADGRITGFDEAPVLPHWINAGIYLFEPGMRGLLPDLGDHETATFPRLAAGGRLGAYEIDGYWRGIDTAKDLKEANRDLRALGWAA
ncbi:nucleotidyltransferase family protein [Actinocorallia populi]|uniref:nucleotidyltransferase family protein n=1 Tax=Actinocorallia populi TaxID=2079200 RepID=UPI001E596B4E|nr:nucleotidyltransferase family protein [Actinocorallia populi]